MVRMKKINNSLRLTRVLLVILAMGITFLMGSTPVFAAEDDANIAKSQEQITCESSASGGTWIGTADAGSCQCPEAGRPGADGTCPQAECDQADLTSDNCTMIGYLASGIDLMSAIAGMAILASIMIAAYQYMTARDNSGQVETAKKRIFNAIIALVFFIFAYSILNYLVPGGPL